MDTDVRSGMRYALSAYIIWGFAPIYFKQIEHISALEITANRVVWALCLLFGVIALKRGWEDFRLACKRWPVFLLSASLIASNWLVFVWAVNNEHIIETSLGYFINPLVSVLLGRLFFAERLRRWQAAAIGLAVIGVMVQVINYGELPWIALFLATSFAFYGLLRKRINVSAVTGLALETVLLLPVAVLYLFWLWRGELMSFQFFQAADDFWLVGAGILTSIPLLLFNAGVTKIPLTIQGLFQYVAPSLSMLVAVFLYREAFDWVRGISFACIWSGLAVFSLEGWWVYRQRYQSPLVMLPKG